MTVLLPLEVYSFAALHQCAAEFEDQVSLQAAEESQVSLTWHGSPQTLREFLNLALDLSAREACQ